MFFDIGNLPFRKNNTMNKQIFKQLALAGTLMVNGMQGEICKSGGESYGNTNNNTEVKGWCGKCCRTCDGRNRELKEGCCNVCKKWKLTVDFIMIVGKYVETNNDFINIMKVFKKYKELVLMYKFNPISDISLYL